MVGETGGVDMWFFQRHAKKPTIVERPADVPLRSDFRSVKVNMERQRVANETLHQMDRHRAACVQGGADLADAATCVIAAYAELVGKLLYINGAAASSERMIGFLCEEAYARAADRGAPSVVPRRSVPDTLTPSDLWMAVEIKAALELHKQHARTVAGFDEDMHGFEAFMSGILASLGVFAFSAGVATGTEAARLIAGRAANAMQRQQAAGIPQPTNGIREIAVQRF
jgi:hypothetical protein